MPILLVLLMILLAIVIGPAITIWALNELFHLGIVHTVYTHVAVLWLGVFMGGSGIRDNR